MTFKLLERRTKEAARKRLRFLLRHLDYQVPRKKRDSDAVFFVCVCVLASLGMVYFVSGVSTPAQLPPDAVRKVGLFLVVCVAAYVLKRLFIYGAEPLRDVYFRCNEPTNSSPLNKQLFDCVMSGDLEQANALLSRGADPNARGVYARGHRVYCYWSGEPYQHWFPCEGPAIFAAVEREDIPMLKLLLAYGAALYHRDAAGLTVIHLAAEKPANGILEAVLEALEMQLVQEAERQRRRSFREKLLLWWNPMMESGRLNLEDDGNAWRRTALLWATSANQPDAVRLFHRLGADPHRRCLGQKVGEPGTAAEWAHHRGSAEIRGIFCS